MCDEVQTGIGRTGRFLALEHWGLEPDLICVAKALSGGLVPVGAVLASRAVMDAVFDGMERSVRHGSTFGGNDLAAAAALATLRVLEREQLCARAERLGEMLLELTRPLVERFEVVREVRGLGLMWAIEFGAPPGGRGAAAVGAGRGPPAGAVRPAGDGAAVPQAPHLLPGRGPSHERDQGPAGADGRGVRAAPLRGGARGDDRRRRALPDGARALRASARPQEPPACAASLARQC